MKLLCVLFVAAALVLAAVPATAVNSSTDQQDWSSVQTEPEVDSFEPVLEPLSDEIDQNQPSGPVYMASFSQGDLAQSFMQTNENISGAGILLQAAVGSSDNVTIQLWDNLPNAGGTMLAEASATGTAGTWVDVFWAAVEITPATTYFLVFTGNTSLGVAGDTNNPYPNGHVYANSGYQPYTAYDYAFRTYYDTEVILQRNTWASVKVFFE